MTPPAQIVTVRLSSLPPSANNLYVNSPRGRFKSKTYRAWLEKSGWEIKEQRPGSVAGPYGMTVTMGRVAKRRDLSNTIKGLEDLLVTHRIIEDDSLAQTIRISWASEPGVVCMICATKER